MRVAIAGGTGCIGRLVVDSARAAGHEAIVISRSNGVDLLTGRGLDAALRAADVVIDVANTTSLSRAKSVRFFETTTRNLLAAERAAGVGHHVALSIVGIDRVPTGYYAGKRRQEELVGGAEVPWTVLRATQFHEFPGQLLTRLPGPIALVPRMRSATVAAREVANQLVELAVAPARGRAPDMRGPEVHDMPDLVRRLVRTQRRRRAVVPIRLPGRVGGEMVGGGLLPTDAGPVGRQTFAEWLIEYSRP